VATGEISGEKSENYVNENDMDVTEQVKYNSHVLVGGQQECCPYEMSEYGSSDWILLD